MAEPADCGERGADMRTYWLHKLAGELVPLEFPSDMPRSVARGYRRQSYRFQLGGGQTRQVEAIGRRHGASQFMVMLAVLKALLYRSTGSDDIIVGSPSAGRVRTELQSQIGPYLNVVALRTAVAGRIRSTFCSTAFARRRSKLMPTSFIRSIELSSS